MHEKIKSLAAATFTAVLGVLVTLPLRGEALARCLPPIEPEQPSRVVLLPSMDADDAKAAKVNTVARLRTRRLVPSGPVNIDILIVYDSRAALWAAGNGGMENFAESAVNKSNAALANTGLDSLFSFRLVGVMELAKDCGNAITTNLLVELQSATGDYADVTKKRNELGADIVSLFIDTGTVGGVAGFGYSLKEDESWNYADFSFFEQYAFNICSIRAVDQGLTLTHEIGHNMGAGHSDLQAGTPGPQFYEYSSAYYFSIGETAYHTIMAYSCDGVTEDVYREIPYFSSPDYQYYGVAVGDATHDNTRTLRNTYLTVSEFRAENGTGAAHVPATWHSSRAEALRAAYADGKKVLLVAGLAGDRATIDTRDISCEAAEARAVLDNGYVLWFSSADGMGHLAEEASCYFTELETVYNPGVAVIDPLLPTKAAACSSGHHSTAELLNLLDDAVNKSAGVASVEIIAPDIVVDSSRCYVTGVVTNEAGESVCVTNVAVSTWRIAAGEAATISADGTIRSVAGKSGEVTVEATFDLWGASNTLQRVVTVVDPGVVTGLAVDGAAVFDLYDETSTVFTASLKCVDGSRYPVDAEWSVEGEGMRYAQISSSGVLSFWYDQYTVYQVATARVSAVFSSFSGSTETLVYGPGYVFVSEFDISCETVSPGADITITPKAVRWWKHGVLDAAINDFSNVQFGWELRCAGCTNYMGDGLSFTVPADAFSTNGYCFVDVLARPTRTRYYDWMVTKSDGIPFIGNSAEDPTPDPTPDDPSDPAVPAAAPELWPATVEVTGTVPEIAASVYDGCMDVGGNVKGTIQVKVGKPKADKNTGRMSAKVTVTIVSADGKKKTLKSTLDVATGKVDGMDLTLGDDMMKGSFGGYGIIGSRSEFVSKDKAEQGAAGAIAGRWSTVNVAWTGGALSVTIDKKGKAKVSGNLASGTKVSAKGQLIMGAEWLCVPVVWSKGGEGVSFTLWLKRSGGMAVATGLGDGVVAGKPVALKGGAAFRVGVEALCALIGDGTYAAYMPDGVAVSQSGDKWIVAGGAKAGKVQLGKDGRVDEAKAGANPSGLKLNYKAKDGSFKGSFKAYANVGGKPKATSVSVTGVMVGDMSYGSATIKKKGSVAVTIK